MLGRFGAPTVVGASEEPAYKQPPEDGQREAEQDVKDLGVGDIHEFDHPRQLRMEGCRFGGRCQGPVIREGLRQGLCELQGKGVGEKEVIQSESGRIGRK